MSMKFAFLDVAFLHDLESTRYFVIIVSMSERQKERREEREFRDTVIPTKFKFYLNNDCTITTYLIDDLFKRQVR